MRCTVTIDGTVVLCSAVVGSTCSIVVASVADALTASAAADVFVAAAYVFVNTVIPDFSDTGGVADFSGTAVVA